MKKILAIVVAVTCVAAFNASAAFYLNVVFDEQGDGYVGLYNVSTMQNMMLDPLSFSTSITDPFNSPATPPSYTLPSSLSINSGDIRIDNPSGTRQGLIRFDSADPSTLFFYTTTFGIPLTMQTPVQYFSSEINMGSLTPSGLTISSGAEGQEYTPTSTELGYISGTIDGMTVSGVNYYIITLGTVSVPEPAPTSLFGLAALVLGFTRLIKRRK